MEGILKKMFSSYSKIGDHEEKLFSAADIFVSACDAWNCGSHLGIRKEINLSRPCEGWRRGKIEGTLGT